MNSLRDRILYWLAIGFGLGKSPVAPGTFGSLLGPPLVWLVRYSVPDSGGQWGVAILLILVGVPICAAGERVLGGHDPGAVVWDEIAAFFLVFALVPLTWPAAIAGFFLFRFFDILKPWPVRYVERLPGGWGVMADDQMAGIYAGGALFLLVRFVFP